MVEERYPEDDTRAYSVRVKGGTSGSGVLFYPGGDVFFVFTCAHVTDGCREIFLDLLIPEDPKRDLFRQCRCTVDASQVVYSPLDTVTVQNDGSRLHSHDIAVIPVRKDERLRLRETTYFIAEACRHDGVYAQGYPGGLAEGSFLLEALDIARGEVLVNPADRERFLFRVKDGYVDVTQRDYEMMGFSGAPVWSGKEEPGNPENPGVSRTPGLYGLLSSGFRNLYRAKVYVVKADLIWSIMKERFHIVLERRIGGISEEEVAGGYGGMPVFDGNLSEQPGRTEAEARMKKRRERMRAHQDGLQLQAAIDTGEEMLADPDFELCSPDEQKRITKQLLSCYEIAGFDEKFYALEKTMRDYGLIEEHDTLRWMTKCFGDRRYDEVMNTAEAYLEAHPYDPADSVSVFARVFRQLSRAYREDLTSEEALGEFIDNRERFLSDIRDPNAEIFLYQLFGQIYGDKYRDYLRAVRCLNHSYRIGSDSVILESLGTAYYCLAIQEAVDEEDRVNPLKVNQTALYKARECYLVIMQKADNLFWSGTISRMGLCVYHTFVLLQDSYRIRMLYPQIRTYIPQLSEEELRNVEMQYAKVICQSGTIELNLFDAITEQDKNLLNILAAAARCNRELEECRAEDLRRNGFEDRLKKVICLAESGLSQIAEEERLHIRIQLLNFYGRGILLFGWDALDTMKRYYAEICEAGMEDANRQLSNFIYEFEYSFDEAALRYELSFRESPSLMNWIERRNFYLRHERFERVDALYRELFAQHPDLIADQPEYAYRAYIGYITLYRRDLKDAIECYIEAKKWFGDAEIAGFLEFELMALSNTFNNPERFESERRQFIEKGLITEREYHEYAFLAYFANLNRQKAAKHFEFIKQDCFTQGKNCKASIEVNYGIDYLSWIGQIRPAVPAFAQGMNRRAAEEAFGNYRKETWHHVLTDAAKQQFAVDRILVADAWALYGMAENGWLNRLESPDRVYVTHLTVIALLRELSRSGSHVVRNVLDYIETAKNIRIQSPDFEHQMNVRGKMRYGEFAACMALAGQLRCPAVIGQPKLPEEWTNCFASCIIRPDEAGDLLKYL